MAMQTGFIGLGNMGAPMAQNILTKFGSLAVYNRSQTRCKELAAKGAVIASGVGDLAEKVDVVFLCLPGPVEVEEIVAGPDGLLAHSRKGQFIVDFSTVAPATSRKLSESAGEKGVTYIDIPVSGGGAGAAKGALSLMIGASREEIQAAGLLPYLEAVGNVFHFIGKRGGGSAIKIINNYMAFSAQIINGEAILMADHIGIPLDTFYDVALSSSGNNAILKAKMDKVKTGDLEPGFVVDLVLKDLHLARQLCQDSSIANFTLNTGIQFYTMAKQLGYGKSDSSSVIKMIRELEPANGEKQKS